VAQGSAPVVGSGLFDPTAGVDALLGELGPVGRAVNGMPPDFIAPLTPEDDVRAQARGLTALPQQCRRLW
jgi:hypothetical protein